MAQLSQNICPKKNDLPQQAHNLGLDNSAKVNQEQKLPTQLRRSKRAKKLNEYSLSSFQSSTKRQSKRQMKQIKKQIKYQQAKPKPQFDIKTQSIDGLDHSSVDSSLSIFSKQSEQLKKPFKWERKLQFVDYRLTEGEHEELLYIGNRQHQEGEKVFSSSKEQYVAQQIAQDPELFKELLKFYESRIPLLKAKFENYFFTNSRNKTS